MLDCQRLAIQDGIVIGTICNNQNSTQYMQRTADCSVCPIKGQEVNTEYPALAVEAWSLLAAAKQFIVGGCQFVSREQYEERLRACDMCTGRRGWRCLECGCFVHLKAHAKDLTCNNWKKL